MLIGDNTKIVEVNGINENDMQRIEDFLQGAVYCWCRNHYNDDDWVSAENLIEGFEWENSCPLGILVTRLKKSGKSDEEAFKQAGIDAGKILKQVLDKDTRTFETKKEEEYESRQYRWIK